MVGNNAPARIVEFTEDQYQFLLKNCEANLMMGLASLQGMTGNNAIRMVELLESFKGIKKALEEAK